MSQQNPHQNPAPQPPQGPSPQDTAASTQMFRAFADEQRGPAGHGAAPEKSRAGLYALIAVVAVAVVAGVVFLAL